MYDILNSTLFGEMLTFAVLVAFTMKFVWPRVMEAILNRQQKIEQGLKDGERGTLDLKLSQEKSVQILKTAKNEAANIINAVENKRIAMISETEQLAHDRNKEMMRRSIANLDVFRHQAKQKMTNEMLGAMFISLEQFFKNDTSIAKHDEWIFKIDKNKLISLITNNLDKYEGKTK